jgi:predicted enzyme related to lactoylglutathione lyase
MTDTNLKYRIKRISPQFLVTNIDRSIDFYSKQLGFEIDFFYETFYAGIIKDGCAVHLKLAVPDVEKREKKRQNEHLDITFSIDGIEKLYEDFKSKSVEIIQTLRDMPYGREFYISDPDGYIIAFLEEK